MNTVAVLSSSIDKSMLFILMLAINTAFSTYIGFISNVTFISSNNSQTYVNMSCMQCTCTALMSSVVGWNCMTNNNTCQLINNYSLTDIGLIKSVGTTFFFQQIPFEPSSTTMNTTTIGTTTTIITATIQTTSISTTSTVHINTTTQNPLLALLPDGSIKENNWTLCTYSYLAATSRNLTLTFDFQADNKHDWYLDDVSVQNSTSMEMLINGNFESTPSLIGWTSGSAGSCSSSSGISSTNYHSSNQSYHHGCGGTQTWIYQSFAAIGGQVYNITFWLYLYITGNGNGSGSNKVNVTMN